jgi:hypothetical protein
VDDILDLDGVHGLGSATLTLSNTPHSLLAICQPAIPSCVRAKQELLASP